MAHLRLEHSVFYLQSFYHGSSKKHWENCTQWCAVCYAKLGENFILKSSMMQEHGTLEYTISILKT